MVRGPRVRRRRRRDLRAYAGAIALVEIEHAIEVEVVRRACIHRDEALGEVDSAEPCEVHREERNVGADVGEAIAVVELDPVDHLEVARVEEHVLEPEITVSVADGSSEHALLEHVTVLGQERELPTRETCKRLRRDEVGPRFTKRNEVVAHVPLDGVGRTAAHDPRPARRVGVERSDRERERIDVLPAQLAPLEEHVRTSLIIEARHLDGPLRDRTAAGAKGVAPIGATADRNDAEIRARCEAPVDPDLVPTRALARLERREVEERERHRLLDLVDLGAEQHPRDVGLDQLHLARISSARGALAELGEQVIHHTAADRPDFLMGRYGSHRGGGSIARAST